MRRWKTTFLMCAAWMATVTLIGCSARMPSDRQPAVQTYVAAPAGRTLGDLVPAQSLPARDEELWIIEKPTARSPALHTGDTADADRSPGCGMLLSVHGGMLTPMPLEKTDVHANIDGMIASVDVQQRFSNTSKELADAVYAFPLPQNAAVNEFVMSIGSRHIRAIVRERAEAEQLYREARSAGLLASLMVQQGPNVFVQHVANIDPGVAIDVGIRYFHTIPCRDGWFEFEFPMIAGLRGSGVPTPPLRDGRNISLTMHIDAGATVASAECLTHEMAVTNSGSVVDASLKSADKIPNRDLLVRYKLAGDEVKAALFTEGDGTGGTFALTLTAPERPVGPWQALESDFVIDASVPDSASLPVVTAMGKFIHDNEGVQLPKGSSSKVVIRKVGSLREAPSVGSGVARTAIIYVTAGHLNLKESLAKVRSLPDNARLIILSVDPSPDREAIEAIARAGRGAAVYLPPGEDAGPAVKELLDRLCRPALTDMEVDWNGANVSEVFPRPSPDLMAGHAIIITGRYNGSPPTSFDIRGKVAGEDKSFSAKARALADVPGRAPLASIWARRKIASLAVAATADPKPALDQQVRQVALEYGLISRYTSFVVIDAFPRTTAAGRTR